MSIENSLKTLEELNKKYSIKSLNEASTRFHIIDKIIKNVFFWPDDNIEVEEKTNVGYMDYKLTNNEESTLLVIEAKRTNIHFNFSQYKEISNNKVKVKVLMKDGNTEETINQVRNYCNDIGCSYACITNGLEWAFFKTFIQGKNWQEGYAYVLTSIEDFIDNFSHINSYLNYNNIANEFALSKLFNGIKHSTIERYDPKLKIHGYHEQIANNYIENCIRGYFDKYFGEIRSIDNELLEECYVFERGYQISFDKVSTLIEDALSPYMKNELKLQNIETKNENSDNFSQKIIDTIIKEKKSKVIILFGGKGAGKTTFLVNLFNNKKNINIQKYSQIGYVNLLHVSNDENAIKEEIVQQLTKALDVDNLLNGTIEDLTYLFKDKYTIDLKQRLAGYNEESENFIIERNNLISQYKEDKLYCLTRLAEHLRKKQKAIIINIDNTDQFNQEIQDYCFSFANELSKKLYCIAIISLREERYSTSNINGYLDAYERNGFHISSPNPRDVFLKRLKFIKNKINSENTISNRLLKDINIIFEILISNLSQHDSEFNKFMIAATHGNIRQGLELFKSFIFSRYTNLKEMVKQGRWTITLHQVLKPIMIPTYRYFSEDTPPYSIPNIFKLRSDNNSSHFTGYRILHKLSLLNNEYMSIYELKSYFIEKFDMEQDFIANIDILLKRNLIESENGYDKYSKNLQKIKITPFGYYMQSIIFKDFTYLELISCDLLLLDKTAYNNIITYSNKDYTLSKKGQNPNLSQAEENTIRLKRIEIRLEKVEKFCLYLKNEEKKETLHYSLSNNLITEKIESSFIKQKVDILNSAKRNLKKAKLQPMKNGLKILS